MQPRDVSVASEVMDEVDLIRVNQSGENHDTQVVLQNQFDEFLNVEAMGLECLDETASPTTAHVIESDNVTPQHGRNEALNLLEFSLVRPKSSGIGPSAGFRYNKFVPPVMNLSREKQSTSQESRYLKDNSRTTETTFMDSIDQPNDAQSYTTNDLTAVSSSQCVMPPPPRPSTNLASRAQRVPLNLTDDPVCIDNREHEAKRNSGVETRFHSSEVDVIDPTSSAGHVADGLVDCRTHPDATNDNDECPLRVPNHGLSGIENCSPTHLRRTVLPAEIDEDQFMQLCEAEAVQQPQSKPRKKTKRSGVGLKARSALTSIAPCSSTIPTTASSGMGTARQCDALEAREEDLTVNIPFEEMMGFDTVETSFQVPSTAAGNHSQSQSLPTYTEQGSPPRISKEKISQQGGDEMQRLNSSSNITPIIESAIDPERRAKHPRLPVRFQASTFPSAQNGFGTVKLRAVDSNKTARRKKVRVQRPATSRTNRQILVDSAQNQGRSLREPSYLQQMEGDSVASGVSKPSIEVTPKRRSFPDLVEPDAEDMTSVQLCGFLVAKIQHENMTCAQRDHKNQLVAEHQIAEMMQSRTELEHQLVAAENAKQELVIKGEIDNGKLEAYQQKITKMQNFIDALGTDMQKQQIDAKAMYQQIVSLTLGADLASKERKGLLERTVQSMEIVIEIKDRALKECRLAASRIQDLENMKVLLVEQLACKSQALMDASARQSLLEEQIRSQTNDQESLQDRFKDSHGQLLQKLADIEAALHSTYDTEVEDQRRKVAAELHDLCNRQFVGLEDIAKLESLIGSIELSVMNRLTEIRTINTESPEVTANAVLIMGQKLQEQLFTLKNDIVSTQDLQAQMMHLRESKAAAEESTLLKDQLCADLQKEIGLLRQTEMALNGKLTRLELQIIEEREAHVEQTDMLKQELDAIQDTMTSASVHELTIAADFDAMKETLKLREVQVASLETQMLESDAKAVRQIESLRCKLVGEANALQKSQKEDHENAIHKAAQFYKKQINATLDEFAVYKAEATALSKRNEDKTASVVEGLEREHAAVIEMLRKDSDRALEAHAHLLNEVSETKIGALRKELTEKASQEKDRLNRQIAEADIAKAEAMKSLENKRRESETILKKQIDQARCDLSDQQSRLRSEKEAEIAALHDSHHEERKLLLQRVEQAETELASWAANSKERHRQLQIASGHSQTFLDMSTRRPTSSSMPRKAIDDIDCMPSRERSRSSFADEVSPVEDCPRRARSFRESNIMISSNMHIYQDPITSSELSELPSRTPPIDSRILREIFSKSPQPSEGGHSSCLGFTQPLEDPFVSLEHPLSANRIQPNSASRMAALPSSTAFRGTLTGTSIPPRLAGSSHRTSLSNGALAIHHATRPEVSKMQTHDHFANRHDFERPSLETATVERRERFNLRRASSPGFVPDSQTALDVTVDSHTVRRASIEEDWAATTATRCSTGTKRKNLISSQRSPCGKRAKIGEMIEASEAEDLESRLMSQSSAHLPLRENALLSTASSPRTLSNFQPPSKPPLRAPVGYASVRQQSNARSSAQVSATPAPKKRAGSNRTSSAALTARYDQRFDNELGPTKQLSRLRPR